MFYVYILKSKKCDELYIGSTNDLKRRLSEHSSGKIESTMLKRPYKLLYYEAYAAESDARRREKMLKLRGQARQQLKLRLLDTLLQSENQCADKMPLIPKDTKTKVILFFILAFIIAGVIYFEAEDARTPVVIDTPNEAEDIEIPKDAIFEDGVFEEGFDNATTTDETLIKGHYETYTPDKVSEANDAVKVVLFFNASWCPTCQLVDRELTSAKIPDGLIVLSVDYDSYLTLRKKYEVTYQHTFVQVDAEGNMIKKWSGGGLGNIIKMINSQPTINDKFQIIQTA